MDTFKAGRGPERSPAAKEQFAVSDVRVERENEQYIVGTLSINRAGDSFDIAWEIDRPGEKDNSGRSLLKVIFHEGVGAPLDMRQFLESHQEKLFDQLVRVLDLRGKQVFKI